MADSETISALPRGEVRAALARMPIEPISHRGFWKDADEKNTEAAFRRALEAGFGIETDIRDRNGKVVIAHDVADPGSMTFRDFLALYNEYPARPMLALNIKADGLQALVKEELGRQGVERYFAFDMSIPDLLGYRSHGVRFYARVSDHEPTAIGIEQAVGIWLDQFESDWVGEEVIGRFTDIGKDVCIVSPELHRRDPREAWDNYHKLKPRPGRGRVYLCTDYPSRAREFFQ